MSQIPAAPPGAVSAVSVSSVSSAAAVATALSPRPAARRSASRARRCAPSCNPSAVVGLLLLAAVLAVTLFGPALMPADPFEIVSAPMEPPGAEFLLGTDYLGRDVLTGLVHGGRATLLVGVVAAVLSVLIGVTVGALAGYYGGWIDEALMRVTEFFQVLPTLLFAMVLVTLFSPSLATIAIAIGVVSWTGTARLARGEFLRLKRREYVLAERVIGAGDARIIWRVILPNALAPLIVSATLAVGTAVLFEAGLSFLGLGDPNVMSWGLMIGSNRPYILTAWWAVTLPGAAIFLTVLAVSLIGDGLNDALNPASRDGYERRRPAGDDARRRAGGRRGRSGAARGEPDAGLSRARPQRRRAQCGQLRAAAGRDAVPGGRVRLRQEHDRAGHHAAGARAGRIGGGRVLLRGEDLAARDEGAMRQVRGNSISMIFQEPMTALNPVYTVGEQIAEPLRLHQGLDKAGAGARHRDAALGGHTRAGAARG